MIQYLRFFLMVVLASIVSMLAAQSDTLVLKSGKIIVGDYKASFNHQNVEGKKNLKEVYLANDVKYLATSKKYYKPVAITTAEGVSSYIAERILFGNISLYKLSFSQGYFSANSVAQDFFFFEKNDVRTYINKGDLRRFYSEYLGGCFNVENSGKLYYDENSIKKVLNAYNKCIDPNAKEVIVESVVSEKNLVVFGGVGNLTHYPLNTAFNGGRFKNLQRHFGLGMHFLLQRKVSLGLEFEYTWNDLTSPIFLVSLEGANPYKIKGSFKTYGLNFISTYRIKFKKLSISPGASFGVGKIKDYTDHQVQPEIYVNNQPFEIDSTYPNLFAFNQALYNFKAFTEIGYALSERIRCFARGGFNISFTKSEVGTAAKQGNHAIDGYVASLGLVLNLKNGKK